MKLKDLELRRQTDEDGRQVRPALERTVRSHIIRGTKAKGGLVHAYHLSRARRGEGRNTCVEGWTGTKVRE